MSEWVWVWVYQASPGRRRDPESSRAPARSILTRRAPAAHTAGPSPATEIDTAALSPGERQPALNMAAPGAVRTTATSPEKKRFHLPVTYFHIRAGGFALELWFDFL